MRTREETFKPTAVFDQCSHRRVAVSTKLFTQDPANLLCASSRIPLLVRASSVRFVGMLEAGIDEVVYITSQPPRAGKHEVSVNPAAARKSAKCPRRSCTEIASSLRPTQLTTTTFGVQRREQPLRIESSGLKWCDRATEREAIRERLRRCPEHTHHGKDTIGLHRAAKLSPFHRRRGDTCLQRELMPRQTTLAPNLVQRSKQADRIQPRSRHG